VRTPRKWWERKTTAGMTPAGGREGGRRRVLLVALVAAPLLAALALGGLGVGAAAEARSAHTPHGLGCWWVLPWCWSRRTATPSPTGQQTQTPDATPTHAPTTGATRTVSVGDGVVAPRDDATCAGVARAQGDAREAIPANATANARNDWAAGVRPAWDGQDTAQADMGRVTGNFTGTTDQILAWAACKWGFPLDIVRAQASQESDWRQSLAADCGVTTQPETHGCASVGILQVKGADIPPTHHGTWPYAYESTSWNADYAYAVRRACYDGKITWLGNGYRAGDLWGCVGQWFSGRWHDAGAESYIAKVKQRLAARTWEGYYR
jgi:hypothetical protein